MPNLQVCGQRGSTGAASRRWIRVRSSVVQDKALSFDAKNAKIIVNGGMVTLRGPVDSEQEKAALAEKAAQVVGKEKVRNQLEVKARKK